MFEFISQLFAAIGNWFYCGHTIRKVWMSQNSYYNADCYSFFGHGMTFKIYGHYFALNVNDIMLTVLGIALILAALIMAIYVVATVVTLICKGVLAAKETVEELCDKANCAVPAAVSVFKENWNAIDFKENACESD